MVVVPGARTYPLFMGNRLASNLELFFDGDCPLCAREVSLLRRLDSRGRIVFTDISGEAFEPASYQRSQADFAATIHARLVDTGEWLTGFEVFRQLYSAVGFGFLASLTRIPVISHCCEAAYRWFAANRLRLTGRCDEQTCSRPVGQR